MTESSSVLFEKASALLTLEKEDEEILVVGKEDASDTQVDHRLVLVGRLATDKPVKFHILRNTMATTWRPGKGVNITEVSSNLFLFQFFHEIDMNRVVEDGPWSFEQNLLVLKKLEQSRSPTDTPLNSSEFWVQVYNLPVDFFSEKVATVIGSALGTFVRADEKNFNGTWKTFLRIRVLLDITKPLRPKLKMKREGGDGFWAEFKYERLPNFCFLCGIIGHKERYCHKLFDGLNPEAEKPYGPWLRATGRRTALNTGNQWLVSELPRQKKIPVTETVESMDSDSNAVVVTGMLGKSLMAVDNGLCQKGINLHKAEADKNQKDHGKSLLVVDGCLGQSGTNLQKVEADKNSKDQEAVGILGHASKNGLLNEEGLLGNQRKRKRPESGLQDGLDDCFLAPDASLGSSNIGLEVGPEDQARLHK